MKIVLLILSWLFGCAFALLGIVLLFDSLSAGIVLLVASLILLPPVREFVYERTNKQIPATARVTLVAVLFAASMVVVTLSAEHKATQQEAKVAAKQAQVAAAKKAAARQHAIHYFASHKEAILSNVEGSISSKHYKLAISQANKYAFVKDPQLNKLHDEAEQALKQKPKQAQKARKLAKQKSAVNAIEQRYHDNSNRLKKYYATAEQVKQSESDIIKLVFIKVAYEKSKSRDQRALSRKASRLVSRVSKQARTMYASVLEEASLKSGMNMSINAVGGGRKHLRISYALMSKVLVYKFQNKVNLAKQAKTLGFTRIIFTNGFDSYLGKTWTVKVQ